MLCRWDGLWRNVKTITDWVPIWWWRSKMMKCPCPWMLTQWMKNTGKLAVPEFIRLTLTCNWRFINLNTSFKNVTGTTKRSLFVYSDVRSGVVGIQVTDFLCEVNYNREGKGSRYLEPPQIQYIQVRKKVLNIIEVQVSETTGELVKFGAGHTIVTLHFKKTCEEEIWYDFIPTRKVVSPGMYLVENASRLEMHQG